MKSMFWCCFDIIFHILHVLWKKPHQQNGGGNLLFLHQHRRPRQTASKEAVEKNVGDLNETLKLLPRMVCLCGFFSRFFSSCWCGVGVWKFTGCFVFMNASWPPAGLWECFTPFILHRSTCIMSFEGDSVYSILFRKKSYHNMMWQGALCENLTSFCCKG